MQMSLFGETTPKTGLMTDATTLLNSASDYGVKGYPQTATLDGNIITVTGRLEEKEADIYTFPLLEWKDTYQHTNPYIKQRELLSSKASIKNNTDPFLVDRIIEAQIRAVREVICCFD